MATQLSTPPTADAGPPVPAGGSVRRRVVAMSLWAVAFVLGVRFVGVPTSDPLLPFFWLWTATIAWRSELPWRRHLAFLRDWLPIVLLLAVYNLSRGYADEFGDPYVTELIDADVWLSGWATGGQVPTVWPPQRLYRPGAGQWGEIGVPLVYFSPLVAPLAGAVVLWPRCR